MIFILLNLLFDNLFLFYSLSIMFSMFYGIYLLQYCDRKHIRQRARLLGLKLRQYLNLETKSNTYIFMIIYLDIIHGFVEGILQMPSLEKVRKMVNCDTQTDPMNIKPEIIEKIVEKIITLPTEEIKEIEKKEENENSFMPIISPKELESENENSFIPIISAKELESDKKKSVKFSELFEISSFTDQSIDDNDSVVSRERKSIFIKKKKKNSDKNSTVNISTILEEGEKEETNKKKIKINVKKIK